MNNQNKHYQQLTQEPRYQISALRKAGMSMRVIGELIGVHFSTVNRELKRNATENGYDPGIAQKRSENRKRTALKANKKSAKTDQIISESVSLGWSPETISKRLKIEAEPDDQLCHTTIYRRIEEDREQGGLLYRRLPQIGKKRRFIL